MDPLYSGQDVVRCTLCQTAVAPMYCEVCHIHLCEDCIVQHLCDKSKVHKVVSLKQFLLTTKCPDHPTKQCELHCEQCNIPICISCISSGKHSGHKAVDASEDLETRNEYLRRDLQELEKYIFPKYQEASVIIMTQKADQQKHSKKMTTDLNKHGEVLHNEIDTIIQIKQTEIDDMDTKLQTALDKQEDAINHTIAEIRQVILDLKSLLDTSNVFLVSKYKSRNEEFRILPPKLKFSFPNFQPQKINREQLIEQFGSLSPLSIETEEQGNSPQSAGAEFSPPDRPLMDVPHIITELATDHSRLYGVSCLSNDEIWTRGDDKILKLYNLQGELVKSMKTKSRNTPQDIAVTRSGDLLYADYLERSVNIVKKKKIQPLMRLREWRPLGLCSTSSDDILVIMHSADEKQTKVARYSGSTEKQSIQWDDQGKPLYSSGPFYKYLNENRNLDICVADCDARALVVVSADGKLRFRYTGPPFTTKKTFHPFGIATDSQCKILTADCDNKCINILDQNGHFLHYIDNVVLLDPWGLCVDSRDYLFVAEWGTGKVKKIQYYK